MTDGLSAADVMALTNRNNCDAATVAALTDNDRDNMWNNPFVYLVWIWAFSAFGGNGFGFGNRDAAGNALTQAELQRGFDTNTIVNKLDGLSNGLCDGFYAMNTTALQGFNGVEGALCQGFNNVNSNINQARFDNQQCCCETNRNIDGVKYEMSKGFCDVINAQNQNTQRILDKMCETEIQTLRDNLQTANFQLSQQAQNASLISQLRPFPTPAYITCSPYTTNVSNVGYGCNCNCA